MEKQGKSMSATDQGTAEVLGSVLGKSRADFIEAAYRLVLGRPADADGVAHYLDALRRGMRRRELLAKLFLSAEGKANRARNAALEGALGFEVTLARYGVLRPLSLLARVAARPFRQAGNGAAPRPVASLPPATVPPMSIEEWGMFDVPFYAAQAGLPASTTLMEAFAHYESKGWLERLDPHPLFSTRFYLKAHRDVARSGMNPLEHYLVHGFHENRPTTSEFNEHFYRVRHRAQIPERMSGVMHYARVGAKAGFSPVDWLDEAQVKELQARQPGQYPLFAYKAGQYAFVKPNRAIEAIEASCRDGNATPAACGFGPLDIVLPFYKEPHLFALQQRVLLALSGELKRLRVRLIPVLDSPEDPESSRLFDAFVGALSPLFDVLPLKNEANVGFIASSNRGLAEALAASRPALLLNSDCFLTKECLAEMLAVAQCDSLIGFVCPRSNNATICTYPGLAGTWEEQYDHYRTASASLPRITYAPTGVGFCLLITAKVLREVGVLDIAYGQGYNEENDLIMRANRLGYRAVLANHAYAFHMGQQSFAATDYGDDVTAGLLEKRYPEFRGAVARYMSSQEKFLQDALAGACKRNGKYRVLLDATALGPFKNGTSAFITKFVRAFVADRVAFDVTLIASEDAVAFHELRGIQNLSVVVQWPDHTSVEIRFAAVLRLSQPFDLVPLEKGMRLAGTYASFMLDPISYDCQYLYNDKTQEAWELFFQITDGVVYQSKFTAKQFATRFEAMRAVPSLVSYHSLDVSEYAYPEAVSPASLGLRQARTALANKKFLLVVGNHFAHKDVERAYTLLAAHFPRTPIVVLGRRDLQPVAGHASSIFLQSGEEPDDVIQFLYENAEVIVFPSHYEGFGFPLLHAVANDKKLVLRSTEVGHEILDQLGSEAKATFFTQIDELPSAVARSLAGVPTPRPASNVSPQTWARSAAEVAQFLEELIRRDNRELIVNRHVLLRAMSHSADAE